ncbi:hypothetical protein BCR36DRAFT_356603 [Piromyces finnis]|uniref:HSF-type DNA-binding domain-containing protein n=1 Tax=Piromyces finnis TaxID=1754191 RepID=A0A1Y1V3V0_9FUNG|nr:hypothetical protein BCR36DRAFT_356603 [Piromyces finnis]|eukprot:ORX46601.1 hypothetical protein BCR36DRAFT_356603 [Piromyces finnis]
MQYISSKSYNNEQEYKNRNSLDYGTSSGQNNMMNNNELCSNTNSISNYNSDSSSVSNSINNMNGNIKEMNSMNSMNNNINMNNNMNNNMSMNNPMTISDMAMSNNLNTKFIDYSQNGVLKKDSASISSHDSSIKYQDFQKQNFIGKLIEMLNNPEISDLISWHEDKVSVVIKNINEFSGRALPMYFKHNKFNSFTRQLNTYGFSYKKIDDQSFKFQNENFIENKPELLKYISKKKNKNDEDIQSLQIELNELKISHSQLQREYNNMRQLMDRMRIENNELHIINSKLQNQIDSLQKLNTDIDIKYNNMKANNGKIYYNLVSILENLKVNDNREIDYLSDIQSLNNESFDEDGSLYNKRRCTSSESTHSSTFTQNTGNSSLHDSINKSGSYSSGNMNMSSNIQPNITQSVSSNTHSHHSYNKNGNSRIESPRNQSLNNRLSNSNFNNNSSRDISTSYHPPNNNQRTHSLNNPLNTQPQSQSHTQPSTHEHSNHSRRSSSLGIMDPNKRSSVSYTNSPVNKYSSGQNNRSSMISDNTITNMNITNEVNRPPRPISAQNVKKIHRLSRGSNISYLNSPNSLEMDSEIINNPITESTNQNFLSPNNVVDNNQINGNIERNTPSLSSEPSSMYSNSYSAPSRSIKNESIHSNPSILSNKSDFTLRNIDDRSYTIRSSNNEEEIINRNNTYPLNKYMMEENQQVDPTKSYTVPKNHGKNFVYDNSNEKIDYDSYNNKQNSISYLLNPSQGRQQMPNDNMDIS